MTQRPTELGIVAAERVLELQLDDGSTRPVTVRIGAAVRGPHPGGDWCCPFQILGFGDEQVRVIFGVDGVQAMQLTLQIISSFLGPNLGAGRLTFLGSDDLGFSSR